MRITQGFPYEGKLSDARLTDEVGHHRAYASLVRLCTQRKRLTRRKAGMHLKTWSEVSSITTTMGEACQRKAARYDSGITIAQNEIRSSTSANLVSPPPRRIPAFVGI